MNSKKATVNRREKREKKKETQKKRFNQRKLRTGKKRQNTHNMSQKDKKNRKATGESYSRSFVLPKISNVPHLNVTFRTHMAEQNHTQYPETAHPFFHHLVSPRGSTAR
jgi:Na+-translocating ferredoxin:NAD+ oxidoreductase RnfC subunit